MVADIENQAVRSSQMAEKRVRRASALFVVAIASASAVPVCIAAKAPGSAIAVLGAIAAVAQGLQQYLQDQRLGVEDHALAIALSHALIRFRFAYGEGDTQRARKGALDALGNEVDALREVHDPAVFAILRSRGTP